MPRGENLARDATAETRAKGGKARAEAIAKRKAEDAQRIEDAFREREEQMFKRLDAILSAGSDSDALRLILAGFERLAGKPTQRTELSGAVDLNVNARARVADLLARRAPAKRAGKAAQ